MTPAKLNNPNDFVLLEIIPSRGAYIGEISNIREEKEFLMPRDSKFKIVGSKATTIEGKQIRVIQVIEVLDDGPGS